MAAQSKQVYGIGAQFASASALYHAAEKVRDKGFEKWDVFSPFPIHGMDDAMGLSRSKVSMVSLVGGCCGLLTAFALQVYTSVELYPLIVHGKPYLSLPAFFPVMFELTILFTAFATLIGMFGFNMLPRLNHPIFNWEKFSAATNDGFFLVVEAVDPKFSETETRRMLEEIGGTHVTLIHES